MYSYLANIRSTHSTDAENQVNCKRCFLPTAIHSFMQQLKRAAVTPLRSTSHVETLPANLTQKKKCA
jgi:hypothetical protein